MRKFFTLLLGMMLVSSLFAQLERPETVVKKATVKPVLDGVIDDVWGITDSLLIDRDYDTTNGPPTLGDPGQTWWKALWDNDGFYLLVNVTDDAYYPNYVHGGGNAWEYDKIEVYFDVNFELEDGRGPSAGNSSGHHQMAPDMTAAKEGGQLNTETNTRQHAFLVNAPNYVAEYFCPWSSIKDENGQNFDLEGVLGFDITINDSDPDNAVRRRGVWANIGPDAEESWVNMDKCGKVTLEGAQVIYVDEISISVDGDITEDNQTLQINTEILPEDATNKSVIWQILEGTTARVNISSDGVITPITDGVLIVSAFDGTIIESNELTINISGQDVTEFEVSYLKNGDFDDFDEETLDPDIWNGGSTVVDGVLNITNVNGQGVNPWDWTVSQSINIREELKDDPFLLKMKMWISEPDTFDVDIELSGDNYLRFGNTDWHESNNTENELRSQWRYVLNAEPTWYEMPINNWTWDSRPQVFNLFAGLTNNTVYIDSVTLVRVADYDLIGTGVEVNRLETFDVYPNPTNDKLNINLSTPNAKVVIYNSVGAMMEETVVNGNHHMFDVSRYTPGLYFVKANENVVKFVKK